MSKQAEQTRAKVFAFVTVIAGIIAIVLLVVRITRAWGIAYGGGPRQTLPVPTGGSFGTPGGPGAPTATVIPPTTATPMTTASSP